MTWYRLSQRKYPYYLAVLREGRFKGQYPLEIKFVPDLKKQWDRGGLGSGVKLREFEAGTPKELVDKLKMERINPAFDDVDFYVIRSPGSPRMGIRFDELLRMSREKDL